jgi:cytochrome b subunit of formate dehydrogenase
MTAKEYVQRFSVRQRVEHAAGMTLFLVLAITGLPQEFFLQQWARWSILAMGGIERVRWIHRYAGIAFAALVGVHLAAALIQLGTRRVKTSMVPTRKDFLDAIAMMRYYLRLSDEAPRFDRFDYRQKFEYWGLVIGSFVMIVTGFILFFPVETARILPGQVIPAALLMHGREGLLAFLIVITWHLYNAHFSPESFPFDTSIFTGKTTRERMEKEHPLEYARLVAAEKAKREQVAEAVREGTSGAGGGNPGD